MFDSDIHWKSVRNQKKRKRKIYLHAFLLIFPPHSRSNFKFLFIVLSKTSFQPFTCHRWKDFASRFTARECRSHCARCFLGKQHYSRAQYPAAIPLYHSKPDLYVSSRKRNFERRINGETCGWWNVSTRDVYAIFPDRSLASLRVFERVTIHY